MSQLDHAALLMSSSSLRLALAQMASQHAANLQDPYQLMPYETAEIQECSDTQAGALERGDDEAAAQCQWNA